MPLIGGFGTLATEEAFYQSQGWTYQAGDKPSIGAGPYTIGNFTQLHFDIENDDLWSNEIMAVRVPGVSGFAALRDGYGTYYLEKFLDDWTGAGGCANDSRYEDHTFGWGCVLAAARTSNSAYTTVANTVCDRIEARYTNAPTIGTPVGYTTTQRNGFYGLRGPGRHLRLACALGRVSLAEMIWEHPTYGGFQSSNMWVNWSDTEGVWTTGADNVTNNGTPLGSGYKGFSTMELANLMEGMAALYDLSGVNSAIKTEVGNRIIKVAKFLMAHGVHPTYHHAGSFIVLNYPTDGNIWYSHFDQTSSKAVEPFYTSVFCNTLVYAHRLTGNLAYLNKAIYFWERFCRHTGAWLYTSTGWDGTHASAEATRSTTNIKFMNNTMNGTIQYESDGQLTGSGQLFQAWEDSDLGQWVLRSDAPLQEIMSAAHALGGEIYPGDPTYNGSNSTGNESPQTMTQDWNGGVFDPVENELLLVACGGHTSWFPNYVLGYKPLTNEWRIVTATTENPSGYYQPYISTGSLLNEGHPYPSKIWPDGSPFTSHNIYAPTTVSIGDRRITIIGSVPWGPGSQGGHAPLAFNLTTKEWESPGTRYSEFDANFGSVYGGHWETENEVVFHNGNRVYGYKRSTDTLTVRGPVSDSGSVYRSGRVYNTNFFAILGYNGNHTQMDLHIYNLSTGTKTAHFPNVAIPLTSWPGFEYEPEINKFVVWVKENGRSLYTVDPATGAVNQLILGGPTAPGTQFNWGTGGRFARFAPFEYVLVHDVYEGVWIASLPGATGDAGDPVTPPTQQRHRYRFWRRSAA